MWQPELHTWPRLTAPVPESEVPIWYVAIPDDDDADDGIEVRYYSLQQAAALAPHLAREAPAPPARPKVSAVTEARRAGEELGRKFDGDPFRLAGHLGLEVRLVPPHLLEDGPRTLSHRTLGMLRVSEKRVYLDATLDLRDEWETLAHECVHFSQPSWSEEACQAFARQFVNVAVRRAPSRVLGAKWTRAGLVYPRMVAGRRARMLRQADGRETFLRWL